MKLHVTVNPNPFTSELCVVMHGLFAVNIVIRLTNSRRTVISMAACALVKGENRVQLRNLQRYAPGRYSLEVKLLNGDLLQTVPIDKI